MKINKEELEYVKSIYSKDSIEYLRYVFYVREGYYLDTYVESCEILDELQTAKENVGDYVYIEQKNSWSEWEVVVPFKIKQLQLESNINRLYKSQAMLTKILEVTGDKRYDDQQIWKHRIEIEEFVEGIKKKTNHINRDFKIFNKRVDSYIDMILEGPDTIEECGFKKLKK